MPNHAASLDIVFQALSSPARRAVLEQLGTGPASMTELAGPFHMALPSFSQHLDVLERSGLVRSRKKGRVRTYRLAPAALAPAERWLERQRNLWTKRLDQLDDYLSEMKESGDD